MKQELAEIKIGNHNYLIREKNRPNLISNYLSK